MGMGRVGVARRILRSCSCDVLCHGLRVQRANGNPHPSRLIFLPLFSASRGVRLQGIISSPPPPRHQLLGRPLNATPVSAATAGGQMQGNGNMRQPQNRHANGNLLCVVTDSRWGASGCSWLCRVRDLVFVTWLQTLVLFPQQFADGCDSASNTIISTPGTVHWIF